MSDDVFTIPFEGRGEKEMSTDGTAEIGDLDSDCLEVMLEEMGGGHQLLLEETAANVEASSAIGRGIGNRLVGRVDPMEAAAVTTVLSGRKK